MTLKAYRVDNPGSWSTLCYAATAGQAKMLDFREYHDTLSEGFEAVLAMRVVRVPQCDDFAPETPGIDDDPRHHRLAGIIVECAECGREIDTMIDGFPVSDRPAVLCIGCKLGRTEQAA